MNYIVLFFNYFFIFDRALFVNFLASTQKTSKCASIGQ